MLLKPHETKTIQSGVIAALQKKCTPNPPNTTGVYTSSRNWTRPTGIWVHPRIIKSQESHGSPPGRWSFGGNNSHRDGVVSDNSTNQNECYQGHRIDYILLLPMGSLFVGFPTHNGGRCDLPRHVETNTTEEEQHMHHGHTTEHKGNTPRDGEPCQAVTEGNICLRYNFIRLDAHSGGAHIPRERRTKENQNYSGWNKKSRDHRHVRNG